MTRIWKNDFKAAELLELASKLDQIDSQNPPGREAAVARYIQRYLMENGIPATLSWAAPERPNLHAVLAGHQAGRTLLYNGHLDTVPAGPGWTKDPFGGEIADGRLYGRGAADMKSGLAAMVYALVVLKRMGRPFAGTLCLFLNADEEHANMGMKKMLEHPLTADYAVIGEPTDLDVCIGHKGDARYRIRTCGAAGHTAVVENPDNAIYKMAKIVVDLEKLNKQIHLRTHPLLGAASLTVAQISGGTAPNIVPEQAVIEVDRRIVPGESASGVRAEIEAVINVASERENIAGHLEAYLYMPPHEIDQAHPLTLAVLKAAQAIAGAAKTIKPFLATAESPYFAQKLGIPTLLLGPGSLHQAHRADESVRIRELEDACRIYIRLALDLLQGTGSA